MNILTAIWLVSAILSLLYGFLIFSTGSGSSFFLVWFLVSGFFAFCSFLSFQHRWSHTPGVFRLCFLLPVGTGAAVLALCSILVLTVFPDRGEEELDCVIVLGCQVRPDGEPSRSLRSRLDTAAAYLKLSPADRAATSPAPKRRPWLRIWKPAALKADGSGWSPSPLRRQKISATVSASAIRLMTASGLSQAIIIFTVLFLSQKGWEETISAALPPPLCPFTFPITCCGKFLHCSIPS